jgi:hypothetical protein
VVAVAIVVDERFICELPEADEGLRLDQDTAHALGNMAVHTTEDVRETAVEALLQTMTTDSHGFALHQAASDALTQVPDTPGARYACRPRSRVALRPHHVCVPRMAHAAHARTHCQILGQVLTHELVEKRRGMGRKGKKLAMQLNAVSSIFDNLEYR